MFVALERIRHVGGKEAHFSYKSLVELRAAYMPDAAWAVAHSESRSVAVVYPGYAAVR
jgi:hypothetical protein